MGITVSVRVVGPGILGVDHCDLVIVADPAQGLAIYYWCYRAWLQEWDPLVLDQCLHMTLRWGGWMETHVMSVDFYIPENRADFFVLSWPRLERRPLRDYLD